MEFFFLILLIVLLAAALGSGYPVAFAIPGSAILTIILASICGYLFAGDVNAYFTHGGGPGEWLSAGVINIRRIYRSDESDTLIAIPLFIFMGLILQRSKIAEDLLLAMTQLFGSVRGGLGVSVIIVGALLAATTSVIGATVIAMGMISLPTMLRNNYSKSLATGVVAATGTLGQIVPPSIVLIILNHQLTTAVFNANSDRRELYRISTGELSMPSEFDVGSVSVGEMFMGALVPGLVLVGLYMLYMLGAAFLRPNLAPAASNDERGGRNLMVRVSLALIPPLVLIFLVLGSIIAGVATVNQAGAIGAAGATVMAGYRLYEGRRGAFWPAGIAILALVAIGIIVSWFNVNLRSIETTADVLGVALAAVASLALVFAVCWSGWRTVKTEQTMQYVMEGTVKTTSLVFAILLGAVMLTAAFRAFGGEDLVRDLLRNVPGGFWGQFAVVMLIIFALGFFLDFIEITVVVIPIIAPVILADPSANISALWFSVMLALIIQTSFLTPPFGFALFYLRGVAPPGIRTTDIYKGVVPFIAIQLLALGLVGLYPTLVNYLPSRVQLLSDAAPRPTNPRLQYCMEEYVFRKFGESGETIRNAINQVRLLDLRPLPDEFRTQLSRSFNKADESFVAMDRIKSAEREVAEAAVDYRPVLTVVRELEADIRRLDRKISRLRDTVSRAGGAVTQAEAMEAKGRLETLTARRDALAARVPAGWKAMNEAFSAIQKEENAARRAYRRTVDEAYGPVRELLDLIGDGKKLKAVGAELQGLADITGSEPVEATRARVERVRAMLTEISGSAEIGRVLSRVRRNLAAETPQWEPARRGLLKAVSMVESESSWREQADRQLHSALTHYEAAIADTIGLRGQPFLPETVARDIVGCNAEQRDIFLNF